jgi:hypothetical protein
VIQFGSYKGQHHDTMKIDLDERIAKLYRGLERESAGDQPRRRCKLSVSLSPSVSTPLYAIPSILLTISPEPQKQCLVCDGLIENQQRIGRGIPRIWPKKDAGVVGGNCSRHSSEGIVRRRKRVLQVMNVSKLALKIEFGPAEAWWCSHQRLVGCQD